MDRRDRQALLGLTLLGALLRLPTLGLQSLWTDEAATARVVDVPLGDLLAAVRDSESTPPLFYALTWPFVQVLGDDELVLRLVSALAGIATVPVLALCGARLGGRRAALATGLLAAASPLLVWFAQEARAYALLVLLCGLALLATLDRRPLLFGLAAAAAVATHYFAAFVVLPLAVLHRRSPLRAFGPPAVAGLALLPLFLDQREADRAAFIGQDGLPERVLAVAKQWLSGYDAPLEVPLTALAALLALAGAAALLRRDAWVEGSPPATAGDPSTVARRRVRLVAAVLGVSLALPLGAALVGDDYLLARNLLGSLALALPLLGAGLARLPAAAPAALGAVWVALVAGVALDPLAQREDWRTAVDLAGPPPAGAPRVVAVLPPQGRLAVEHYLGGPTTEQAAPVVTTEVVVVQVASGAQGERRELAPPAPGPGVAVADGFVRRSAVVRDGLRVTRWTSATGEGAVVNPGNLDATLPPAALVVQGG